MSKVSFRARALDATKPMPVFRADEIPDLPDFATINRSVPQMPTGMEKEEETEHHLQRALSAQQVYGTSEALVIPIPEVEDIREKYQQYYKPDFKLGKQYVHIQAFGMDQEIPDYDMDSDDDSWLKEQVKKMEITPLKFEEMMDRLEKGSGQQVVTLQEAKLLLKEDDDLIISVYDYWLNKRLKVQQTLIPTVKTEKRDGTTTNNPYVAFRRRTEKMQTRKNRKNDETSYEKMLKLKRDLSRAVTLLEVIKRREKSKKELLQLTIEILEKRYQGGDFEGKLLAEAEEERHKHPSFIPPFYLNHQGEWVQGMNGEEVVTVRKKRPYRKRKQQQRQHHDIQHHIPAPHYEVDILHQDIDSSDDDIMSPGLSPSDHEDENDPDGPYAFKRRKNCSYYTPLLDRLGNFAWTSPKEGGIGDKKYRFSLMSLPPPRNCVGFGRRRIGRGGRVIIDRGFTPWDDSLDRLDLTDAEAHGDYVTYIREKRIPHFRPRTPPSDISSLSGCPSPLSTPVSEFNFESFQSHQEQLAQMQREQQERLQASELDMPVDTEEMSSSESSQFLLDSASAEFAVSAVVNSSQLKSVNIGATNSLTSSSNSASTSSIVAALTSKISATKLNIPTPTTLLPVSAPVLPTTTTAPMVIQSTVQNPTQVVHVPTNGPKSGNKTTGLSTSPAANVLQLNFPISMCSSLTTSPAPVASLSASSLSSTLSSSPAITTLPLTRTIATNNKIISPKTSILKYSAPASAVDILKQTCENSSSVNSFNKDNKIIPMDVT
ncbi:enhancer of polycomb homolog 1-like [Gigantopelta aegis]|uniref:enhancer of polycomb homolog 1-like n=1 Tax=Gigantopelta aegis TaxID=1735272 RepID=UPI001B88BD44|nr:enhancer of polycomb homolog 1-like [Gigantopelta aegis]